MRTKRQKVILGCLLGALASLFALSLFVIVATLVWRAGNCCGPDIPVYPSAMQVQVTERSIFEDFDRYEDHPLKKVTYRTQASPEKIKSFYKVEFEKRGYRYDSACNRLYGDTGMVMIADEIHVGNFRVTWNSSNGETFVEAFNSPLHTISCDYNVN
jgi:hypothetical protein